jgi:hypothetical protein
MTVHRDRAESRASIENDDYIHSVLNLLNLPENVLQFIQSSRKRYGVGQDTSGTIRVGLHRSRRKLVWLRI